MLIPQKMRAFQEPVAGEDFVTAARTFEQGSIVSHAQPNSLALYPWPGRERFDPLKKSFLPLVSALRDWVIPLPHKRH
jgi:hypothetical protein